MASDNIIEVSEANFEFEVIIYSQNIPVVVDFWASWCRPCKVLSPMLERLARDAGGAFRLAKIDTDANPNLAILYNIRSLPTVKAFSSGQVVAEFTGMQPEDRLREFITKITPPSPATLALEKGESLLALQLWEEAEEVFRSLLEQFPDHPSALLGSSRSLLALNQPREALLILRAFPASRQFVRAQILLPLAEAQVEFINNELPSNSDLDAAFRAAIRLAGKGNLPAALDGLLDLLRQEKSYGQGRARQVYLAILEILGDDNQLTRQYRAELGSVLF
jgi:putative thioredoxin